ncbi:MAG: PEP-CTERM sorting domain-containing protein [Phycisphaerae bacterium]
MRLKTGIVLMVAVCLGTTPAMAGFDVFPICTQDGWQWTTGGAVSGDWVVWYDEREEGPPYPTKEEKDGNPTCGDIYGYHVPTATEIPIHTGPGRDTDVRVSGNTVVWATLYDDILGYDLATSQNFVVYSEEHGGRRYPSTNGQYVFWQDTYTWDDWNIRGKNLDTGDVLTICDASGDQTEPDADGNLVVWQDGRNGKLDVYGYNLATGQEFLVSGKQANQRRAKVSGDWVVWMEGERGHDQDIYGLNLVTLEEVAISDHDGESRMPEIDGNIVVWRDNVGEDGTIAGGSNIWGYDLESRERFVISALDKWQTFPSIDGNLMAWRQKDDTGRYDIYGALLPEPATLALLAVGATAVTLMRRRRGNR